MTVLRYGGRHGSGNKTHWLCQCSCGNIVNVGQNNLKRGVSTRYRECANSKLKHPRQDLSGQHFGHLQVLEYVGDRKYRCKCECGTETIVAQYSLKSGNTKSCGKCCLGSNVSQQELAMVDLIKQQYGEKSVLDISSVGVYRPDCILSYHNTLYDIEYDGAHWHDIAHDNQRDVYFIQHGYRVLRFFCTASTLSKTFVREKQLVDAIQHMELNNLSQYKVLLQ